MSDAGAMPGAYSRWPRGERQRLERPLREALADLRRLLPMGRSRFDRLLASAVDQAARRGTGFYIGGFAGRRALGNRLILDIDPARLAYQLDHRVQQDGRATTIRDRFIGTGDWTPLLHSLARSSTHREVVEIIEAGLQYRETRSYRKGLERAGTPKPVKRNFVALSSPARVETYFRQTAEMCRSVQERGILRSGDYGWRLASFANPSVRLPWMQLGEGDIGVAIGPAGELYRFASGKHRTAAAQALKLTTMPVEIRLVHAEWLSRHMAGSRCPTDALLEGVESLRGVSG